MKKLTITSFVLFISLAATAQDVYMQGYGAVQVRAGNVNGGNNVLIGGYGGWLVNERLMIGAGGFGTLQDIAVQTEGAPSNYEMGYNGLVTEYNLPLRHRWHLVGGALIGGGRFETELEDKRSLRSDIFVAEPHLQLIYALCDWVQAGAGLHYRWVGSDELPNTMDSQDLRDFSFSLNIKVGSFGKAKSE